MKVFHDPDQMLAQVVKSMFNLLSRVLETTGDLADSISRRLDHDTQ